MRSIRLLAVAVLGVILALSSAQIGLAAPQISLSPTCGLPGTTVSFSGSGFGTSEHDPCVVISFPDPGLISLPTCHVTNREFDSVVSGSFVVGDVPSGPYLVEVWTSGIGQSASAGFTVGDCGPAPQPYELCLIQLGVEEPKGTVSWLPGYAIVDVPISQCLNKTEYYVDVLGRTIVIHQFNQTRIDYGTGVVAPIILIL